MDGKAFDRLHVCLRYASTVNYGTEDNALNTKRRKKKSIEWVLPIKMSLGCAYTETKWQLDSLFVWIDPNAWTVKLFFQTQREHTCASIKRRFLVNQHIPNEWIKIDLGGVKKNKIEIKFACTRSGWWVSENVFALLF